MSNESKCQLIFSFTDSVEDEDRMKRLVLCDDVFSVLWDYTVNTKSHLTAGFIELLGAEAGLQKIDEEGDFLEGALAAVRILRQNLEERGINIDLLYN